MHSIQLFINSTIETYKYDELNEQMKNANKKLQEEQNKHRKTKEELKQEQKSMKKRRKS